MLGAALFGLFNVVDKKEANAPAKIVISTERLANLADGFTRTWRRPPGKQELQDLVENYIRDEVFYREGKAAGLDRDDSIIRRRVRQKMEFIAEDMVGAEPSEEQLASYLASHSDRFRVEDRLTFRHVFLSATKRASAIEDDVEQVANVLADADAAVDTAALGDPFLPGDEFEGVSQSEVARSFGEDFAKQLSVLEQGRWKGPISSSYGRHFVFVNERTLGSLPALNTIRQSVHREWTNARRVEEVQKLYHTLRKRYEIVVEAPSAKAALAETRP
jgi:parvulin-like peptidyl-prolyl isomerase